MIICALNSKAKSLIPTIAGLLLTACIQQTFATENRSGKEVYNYYCYQCHAYGGTANTLAATFLKPPPRNFTATPADQLSHQQMVNAITFGRSNTGMVSFSKVLSESEVIAVVNYIRSQFMVEQPTQGRYHTAENGWPNHQRYQQAYPFANGRIALDTPWSQLTKDQQTGKQLFLDSCITCHDRARVTDEGPAWALQAISFPRSNGYIPSPDPVDALSGASVFMYHDIPPEIPDLTEAERQGQQIFMDNCSFCHAADGTGRNWIGQFMDPPARDLTHPEIVAALSEEQLLHIIQQGLPNTSMPAWKAILDTDQTLALIRFLKRAFVKPPPPDADLPESGRAAVHRPRLQWKRENRQPTPSGSIN